MGEELTQRKEETTSKAVIGMRSDTKPIDSLPPLEKKKADFGPENDDLSKHDKDQAHSALNPLPKCSDSGKPTWRKGRRKNYSHEEKKLKSLAYGLGDDLLERMASDSEMMDRIHRREETRRFSGKRWDSSQKDR